METQDFTRLINYIKGLLETKLPPQNADAEQILNICHDSTETERVTEIAITTALHDLKSKYRNRLNNR